MMYVGARDTRPLEGNFTLLHKLYDKIELAKCFKLMLKEKFGLGICCCLTP